MASLRETPASSTGQLARRTQDEDHPSRCWPPARPSGPAGKSASVTLSIRCRSGTSRSGPRRNAAGRPPARIRVSCDQNRNRTAAQRCARPSPAIRNHRQCHPPPARPIRSDRITGPAARDAGPGGSRPVRGRAAPAAWPDSPRGSAATARRRPSPVRRHENGPPRRSRPARTGRTRRGRHRPSPPLNAATPPAGGNRRRNGPQAVGPCPRATVHRARPRVPAASHETGSPGHLKSIYSINLKILAKLEIFCLTLCKTWCSIGESPIPRPSRASRPTSAPGREPRTVHRSHQYGPFVREPIRTSGASSSLYFVHVSGPTCPGSSLRGTIVTTRPIGGRWSRKVAAEVQRGAISACAAGADASLRLGGRISAANSCGQPATHPSRPVRPDAVGREKLPPSATKCHFRRRR